MKPNILLAIADDWSWPHAGAYGCTWVKTPAFDRVAREGLLFARGYTPNAKCAPSRANLLTGRNSWQLEEAANHWCYFPEKFKSVFAALSENGYITGHTAKGWGPGVAKSELTGKGFNAKKATPPAKAMAPSDYAANFADFLDARPDKATPFCFWYGGNEPHRGYEKGSGRKLGKKPGEIDRVPACWPDNDDVRSDLLDYAFEIEHFDTHLGRMLAELERRGELENTVVIVTGDNGMPFPHAKGDCYDLSHHLPLAVRWPKGIAKPGRQVKDFVSFIDIAPTLVELAGLEWAKTGMAPSPGRSLMDLFAGKPKHKRDHVLIGRERHDVGRPLDVGYPTRGIVTEDWLYLRNYAIDRWPMCNPITGYLNCDGSPTKTLCIQARKQPGQRVFWERSFGKRPAEELYDLRTDRDCMMNLVADPKNAARKKALEAQLVRELTAQGDPRMVGKGDVFDKYPTADTKTRGFYERYLKGERPTTGWISLTDFDPDAEKEEK